MTTGDHPTGRDFGLCPWCGLKLAVSHTADYQPTAVMHGLPTCATYDQMDGDRYLRTVIDVRAAALRPTVDA